MFYQELKRDIKDMIQRKEFILAMTISILLIFILLFISLLSFYKTDILNLKPAWFCWGVDGDGYHWGATGSLNLAAWAIKILNFIVLPFIASLSYAYCCYDDRQSGVLKFLIPHVGRNVYYLSNTCAVFIGGFLVIFIPLILEQFILCIAFPLNVPFMMSSDPIIDDYITGLGKTSAPLIGFHLNHPYLFNALYSVIPAITAGLMALLSYSLSLFVNKSRFLIMTLPGLLWVVFIFVTNIPLSQLIAPTDQLSHWIVFTVILVIINAMAIGSKLLFTKDEL